jgi:Na+/proline symporter
METIIISALLVSFVIYLGIGLSTWKHTKTISDMIPILSGKIAKVKSQNEFSSSTVAATISLATVIMAYFELAGFFGTWLLWTALTTCIGLAIVSNASTKIWHKLSKYEYRPSLHEYLGNEYKSKYISVVGAICTSIGFLLVYATELIVGSQFLSSLVPQIPSTITIIVLSTVGFVYTVLGGFRAVIKTDQIQMKFIWLFIFMVLAFYGYTLIFNNQGKSYPLAIPPAMYNFSNRPGLVPFLFGIAVMNIPLFISNMSIWQRISGTFNPEIVRKGLKSSVFSSFFSWALLATIACLAFAFVTPKSGNSLFPELLSFMNQSIVGKVVIFFTVLGLYGAMLSAASTNLIVVAHTIYEDLYVKLSDHNLKTRIDSKAELTKTRVILIVSALFATGLVIGLKYIGFSIADLAFSIYGGGLALCPPIIYSLYTRRDALANLKTFAIVAIVLGFLIGWSCSLYGKIYQVPNLIFLSPCVSFGISCVTMLIGLVLHKPIKNESLIPEPNSNELV